MKIKRGVFGQTEVEITVQEIEELTYRLPAYRDFINRFIVSLLSMPYGKNNKP